MTLIETVRNPPPVVTPDAFIDKRSGKPRRIPRTIINAIRLIQSGEVTTVKAAAERVGLSREHLSMSLGKPHIQAFVATETRKTIAAGTMIAGARLLELMHAKSEAVSFDATKHVLAIEGIKPPDDSRNINIINNVQPGYVINLGAAPTPAPVTIESE